MPTNFIACHLLAFLYTSPEQKTYLILQWVYEHIQRRKEEQEGEEKEDCILVKHMAAIMENEAMATEARYAPVTAERRVRSDLETTLPKPCELSVPIFSFFFCIECDLLVARRFTHAYIYTSIHIIIYIHTYICV